MSEGNSQKVVMVLGLVVIAIVALMMRDSNGSAASSRAVQQKTTCSRKPATSLPGDSEPARDSSSLVEDPRFAALRNPPKLVHASLFISTFITMDRAAVKTHFHRLDVFLTVLLTYAQIPWESVHLWIKLERPHWRPKVRKFAEQLFGPRLKTLNFTRLTKTDDWRAALERCYPRDQFDDNYPVLLSTNDDHPFIDENTDAILEGLEILRDPSYGPWRMAYIIHYPEMSLYLGSCGKNFSRAGKFWVAGNWNVWDGTEIGNLGLVRYLFFSNWSGWLNMPTLIRVDGGLGTNTNGMPGSSAPPIMFLPLRELTRKSIGYAVHPRIPHASIPPIRCPLEDNIWPTDPKRRLWRMTPPDIWRTGWTESVCPQKPVPTEWTSSYLKLTANFTGRPFEKFRGLYKCDSALGDFEAEAPEWDALHLQHMKTRYSGDFPIPIELGSREPADGNKN